MPDDERGIGSWEEARQAQARLGLALTPTERLRWLSETMAALRRWCGRAKHAPGLVGETVDSARRDDETTNSSEP